MIFVTFGTQKQQFTRLINLMNNSTELFNEKVIIQCGYTKCEGSNFEMFDFISPKELEKYMQEADFVISHGGVGSLLTALKLKKKVLAVPRLKKYREHINDHQIEICEELQEQNKLLMYEEGKDFDEAIQSLKRKSFDTYETDTTYVDVLKKEI